MTIPVGSSIAGRIVHPRPPTLRVRYRHGVYIDLRGYPDWLPYATAMVRLGPAPAGDGSGSQRGARRAEPEPSLSRTEARVVDVLTASRLLAPVLAAATPRPPAEARPATGGAPPGWIWAHLPEPRDLALVPADLHAAFRHRGGSSTAGAGGPGLGAGLGGAGGVRVEFQPVRTVAEAALEKLEGWLGYRLPEAYREFLRTTNGGLPIAAGVHAAAGFVVDQPLFGLAATDRMRDVAHANLWFGDRFTAEFLAIGHVQGGLLAIKVKDPHPGSIWFWDDDDPRDDERYQAPVICRDLLVRVADDVDGFLAGLSTAPAPLAAAVDRLLRDDATELFAPDGMGAALPSARRPAWLTSPAFAPRAPRAAPPG